MRTGQPELAGDLGGEVRSHNSDEQEFQEAVPAKLATLLRLPSARYRLNSCRKLRVGDKNSASKFGSLPPIIFSAIFSSQHEPCNPGVTGYNCCSILASYFRRTPSHYYCCSQAAANHLRISCSPFPGSICGVGHSSAYEQPNGFCYATWRTTDTYNAEAI